MELALILALAVAMVGGVVLFALQASRQSQDPATDALGPTTQSVPIASAQQQVTCTEDGATVGASSVDAGDAGVPTTVTGTAGETVVFTSADAASYRFVLASGTTEAPLPLHPATWDVACSINPGFAPTFGSGAAFTVLDPDGLYVPTNPEAGIVPGCSWRGVLRPSYEHAPERAIRSGLTDDGLVRSDRVERAGYPESGFRSYPPASDVYRVMREDEILARIDVVRAEGQWRYSVLGCVD